MLLLSLMVQAESVTATVNSKNSASLSDDVPKGLGVSFVNESSNKGQVMANGMATLTISNWPNVTIQSITLYMHSNQSSGAATILLSINDSTWQVTQGNFNQWPGIGTYSTSDLSVPALKRATHIRRGSSLILQIKGTANSVYLQKMIVEYTLTPPSPYSVTLQYPSDGGPQYISLKEDSVQAGVILPPVPDKSQLLTYQGETWYFYGWSEHSVSMQSFSPLCWQPDDWYGPEEDIILYAIYTNAPEQTIRQDSSCTSGEYAIVLIYADSIFALSGDWKNERITLKSMPIFKAEDGHYQWKMDTLANQFRYSLQFMADSVTIQHVATGSWIGHDNKCGKNLRCKWAWRRAKDGSIYIHNQTLPNTNPSCLSIKYFEMDDEISAVYASEPYDASFPYWRLFPTATVPAKNIAKYSALSTYVALPSVHSNRPSATKILDHNGRILIYHQTHMFNILGSLQQ